MHRLGTIFLSFLLLFFLISRASGNESHSTESKETKLNPGELIMEHIVDSHEWHIAQIGETHITVPLPVILIYQGEFHAFMSSKFHHGEEAFNGFRLISEGKYKGKIVKVQEDGLTLDTADPLPIDLSITKTVFAILFSSILLSLIFISVARAYKRREGLEPKGLMSWVEPIILFVRDDIALPSIGHHNYLKYMPYLLTVFFFIFINNLLGLIPLFPGGANVTGNIAVTLVMALFTFIITSVKANKQYWLHIVNTPGVPWWLKFPVPLMPVVELMGVLTKPFVLMVRLFANITAGHIIILSFVTIIFIFGNINVALGYGVSVFSVVFIIFMSLLELLVAFIQAYVFTLLSALYFGMATEEHH